MGQVVIVEKWAKKGIDRLKQLEKENVELKKKIELLEDEITILELENSDD